jgi:hypothetical protein
VADWGSVIDFWLGDIAKQATSGARVLSSESPPPRESQSSVTFKTRGSSTDQGGGKSRSGIVVIWRFVENTNRLCGLVG